MFQVKDDNAEIATMERQIAELQERSGHLQEEQSQLDEELDENQSERNQKYRELRKREENMDAFLAGFEEGQAAETARLAELEQEIRTLAEDTSRELGHVGRLPTAQGYSTLRDDLAFKEGEAEKSKNTLEGVNREHSLLQQNLEKVNKESVTFQC